MVGIINKEIVLTPFSKAVKHIEGLNPNLLRMVEILSL
jgi:6-phosphofructokinase 1